MELAEIQDVLRRFIVSDLLADEADVGLEDNLLADGMVDSVGVGRLVAFVDERFDYSIPVEDLLIENFGSIEAISAYLQGRLSESA